MSIRSKIIVLSMRFIAAFLLMFLSTTTNTAQGISDAAIDDAPMENVGSEKNQHITTAKDSQPEKSKFEYRLYSIGNVSYQPITDTQHLAVANGLFQEKSATAEINLEMTHRTDLPKNANMVVKTDVQGKISSQYAADSFFFNKGDGDWLKLNELFFEGTNALGISVLFGKYRRIFSPGLFQNPMDRHNPKSSLPGEPAQREGAWLAQLSFDGDFKTEALSRWRISAAYLPGSFLDKYGMPAYSRNKFILNPRSPLGISKEVEAYSTGYLPGFVRLYLDIFKGDFNAIYYYIENQHQEGISYSRYFLDRLECHGEILFYEKPHSDYIITEPDRNLYVDALAGFRIDIGDYTTLTLEYLYRQENLRNYPDLAIDQKKLWLSQLSPNSNGQASTPMRNYLVISLMTVNLKDIFDIAFNVVTNPFDQEYLFSLRTDYKVDKSSKISLAGLYKYGDSHTFYGNYFPFDYQVRLEFYIALL